MIGKLYSNKQIIIQNMINYQFFPRSHGVTPQIRDIINCFKKVDEERDENVHLKSNEMLALVRPHLEALRFTVETGKAADEQCL